MATVETLSIDVKASVDKAVSSLKRFSGAMTEVKNSNDGAAKATKETTFAFEASASGLLKAANMLKGAGLKNLAKEYSKMAELVNFRGLEDATKSFLDAADQFAQKGDESTAKFIRDRANLVEKEREITAAIREQAEAEKALAEAQAKAQQIQETSAKSELAYVEITKKAQLEKADAILKSYTDMASRIAKENAASDKAYADLTKADKNKKSDALLKTYTEAAARIAKENEASDKAFSELTKTDRNKKADAKIKEIIDAEKERQAQMAEYVRIAKESEAAYERMMSEERNRQADAKIKQIIDTAQERQAALQKVQADKEAEDAAEKREKEENELAEALRRREKAERKVAQIAKRQEKSQEAVRKAYEALGNIMPKLRSKFFGFFRMFGRIAMYRAVRAAIKALTAALKEGLTNLKAYSKEVGTAFAPAVDNLRSHVLWLKNAIATALRPVIEALIPIIQRLVDWLVKASDFLAQVFSLMTGRVDENGRYTKAILTDIQESNEEAKKLQRTLLGFDEINRLDGNNGKDNTQNAGLMFTQADVSAKAVEWAARLSKWLEKIKSIINEIDWETVLKVIAALKGAQILKKILGWVKSIAAVLSGTGGLVVLALAVAGAFALWGDEIQEFIESTGIKKVKDFFEKLKKPFGEKGLIGTWLTNGQIDLTYLLKYIGNIAKIIHDLFHGDVDGAIETSKKTFRDYFDYLMQKFDLFAGWVWDNVFAPVANWAARVTYNIYRDINNAIIDVEIALNEGMLWVLKKWNAVLAEIEESLNNGIAAFNLITGRDVKPITLHVDMKNYYDAIDTLESKRLPPLKENVRMYGTWEQEKAKFNLDTTDAERKVNNISQKISEAARKLLDAITKGNNAIGSGGSRNASPFSPNQYASGGFPSMGSLFVAGESGAEYIADINGRTGVYNTDQMSNAMYKAMVAALATMPQQGGDIYLDGEVIYRNTVRRNNNQVRATGRTALLT